MRVAFFAYLPFHRPILAPVRDAVGEKAECLLTSDRRQVVAFGPDVLVMTGHPGLEYFRRRLPRTLAVNVRHGMIGKRGISRLPARPSVRTFDFVCVGSQDSLPAYEQGGARPVEYWQTGYPQIDPLFRRDPPPALPLDPGRPTVLYAPTWNLGLTSATMLGGRLVELIRSEVPGANIIIKPHPVIGEWRPRWMARWASLAAREPGVLLVRDTHADIVPYMLAADLLISDASSAVFEFLALDRPIVLVTNPRHRADPAYAPDSIVWRWRDVGDEVHDVARLPGAVAATLRFPGRHGERRRHYAELLFGALTDGRNHVRVAERILTLEATVARRRALAVPVGAPAATWHDLRSRLSTSPTLRRVLLGRLEAVRLRVRGWLLRYGDRPRRSQR